MKFIKLTTPLFLLSFFAFLSCSKDNANDFKRGLNKGKFSHETEHIYLDSIPKEGTEIMKWKFRIGDDTNWALPNFNDSTWDTTKIADTYDQDFVDKFKTTRVGWLRCRIYKDSLPQPMVFVIKQMGASEVFVNGKKWKTYGEINKNGTIKGYNPLNDPLIVQATSDTIQVVAIRFGLPEKLPHYGYSAIPSSLFRCSVYNATEAEALTFPTPWGKFFWTLIKIGIFFILTILHFNFYRTKQTKSSNLYFALYTFFLLSTEVFSVVIRNYNHETSLNQYLYPPYIWLSITLINVFFLLAIYKEFELKLNWIFWTLLIGFCCVPIFYLLDFNNFIVITLQGSLYVLLYLSLMYIVINALDNKKRGAKIFAFGIFSIVIPIVVIFLLLILIPIFGGGKYLISNDPSGLSLGKKVGLFMGVFVTNGKDVIMSVCLSLYLSLEYTHISEQLTNKLEENKRLAEEKQHILASQNELLEHQVNERTAELNASLEALRATQDQLIQKEKLASLGELTAGIAHEIQNPLNFVNNFSELSVDLVQELQEEREKPIEKQDEGLIDELLADITQNQEKINHHGKRASSIVKGMLEHSRASTGEKKPTNINELADEFLRLSFHGMRAKDKGFQSDFKTDFEGNLPEIEVIPQDLGRVLLNLINNAFYAVNERKNKKDEADYKPIVVVSTKHLGNSIEITVADNGTGIPKSIKTKIFQPFFTTKPTGEGTGLGLSLSYDIITKGHGGTFSVESKEGEGTKFVLTLPIG